MAVAVKINNFALLLLLLLILMSKCSSSNENNPGISEASPSFIQTVLESCVTSTGKFDTVWLVHGLIIRSDQRRSILLTPECNVMGSIKLQSRHEFKMSCFENGATDEPVKATGWKDNSSSWNQPRRLCGLNNVHLIRRVYMCK